MSRGSIPVRDTRPDLLDSVLQKLRDCGAEIKTGKDRICHVDRGYENIEEKLVGPGARIRRVPGSGWVPESGLVPESEQVALRQAAV
jgi:UDP-N-acetylglucosamine enolpyruvyl transferase